MYIYKTKLARNSIVPTQLEFLEAAFKRGLLPKERDRRLFRNLTKGEQGEQYVIEMLQKFGCDHWIVVRNLWLEQMGKYESDVLLLTSHGCYTLEIKNYDGKFEYKNSRCYLNGKKMKENCIHQAEKASMNLEEICQSISRSVIVKGALLFVGEYNEVDIKSPVDGIQIVTRNSVRNFIRNIVREEEMLMCAPVDGRKTLDHFEEKEVLNPFGPLESFSPDEALVGRRGIYCKECASYETKLTRKLLRCKNGHEESRDEAVLRMIEEFGTLTFQSECMTKSHLMEFLGAQVSETYLLKLLKEYFVRVNN